MAKAFHPQVLTANRLRAGDVVYLADGERWVRDLTSATVAGDAAALTALEGVAAKAVDAREVVAVYAIDVDTATGVPKPVSVKEHIRAAGGPTI